MNGITNQPNLLELAKQGNAQAIATLMNRQLQPKGITAKAALLEGCLQIMLESAQVPNQQALVAFVRKGLTSLGAVSIERVRVYGRQTAKEVPAWSQDFELSKAQPFSLNAQVERQKPQVEKQKEQPDKIESAKEVRASSVKKGKISFAPVSQTKFAVEQVGDSKAAELMQGAVTGHLLALQYWRCDLENEGYDDDARCRDALLPEIFAKYPVIQEKAQPVIDKSDSTYHSFSLDNKVILKLIWMNVNVEILEAETKIRLGQR
jgi:hypothetical protein